MGGGIALNVALRQTLDLYACVRPVRWFKGVPSPVKHPELVDMVIFRENTEDVYAGKELESGSDGAKKLLQFLDEEFGWEIRPDSGIGIKPVSETGSKRLIRAAINYALANNRKSVTLVHKGNIMKFTEGAFRNWGYELVEEEFSDVAVSWEACGGEPGDKLLVQDVIADAFLQQILTRPANYDVIATMNLNGDYISDALAAQVGGIGIAPGGNINYDNGYAVFEATHGTAPKYAGQDKVNPGSVILSGEMMLRYMGWNEAADLIVAALEATITRTSHTTYPPHGRRHRGQDSEFGTALIERTDAARWSSAADDHLRAGGVRDQVLVPRPEMLTTGSSPDARAQHEQVGLELFYRSHDPRLGVVGAADVGGGHLAQCQPDLLHLRRHLDGEVAPGDGAG